LATELCLVYLACRAVSLRTFDGRGENRISYARMFCNVFAELQFISFIHVLLACTSTYDIAYGDGGKFDVGFQFDCALYASARYL